MNSADKHRQNRELLNFILSALVTLTMIWSMFPVAGLAYASAAGTQSPGSTEAAASLGSDPAAETAGETYTAEEAGQMGTVSASDVSADYKDTGLEDADTGTAEAEGEYVSASSEDAVEPEPSSISAVSSTGAAEVSSPASGTALSDNSLSRIRLERNATDAEFASDADSAQAGLLDIDSSYPVELVQPYVRTGYVFAGWSTTPDNTDTTDMQAVFVPAGAVLLNWTFLSDINGDGVSDPDTETFDLSGCIRLVADESADGSGIATLVLYAQWEAEGAAGAGSSAEQTTQTAESADASLGGVYIGIKDNRNALADVRDISGGAADELSLVVTEDIGSTGTTRTRSRRSVPVSSDENTSITNFRIYWLNTDASGDDSGAAAVLSLNPTDDSAQTVTAQLDLSLSGTLDHEAGSIRIHVPAHIFQQRGTDEAAYGNLVLPLAESPSTATDFNWSYVDGEYILVNTRTLSAASQVSLQLAYENVFPSQIVDNALSAGLYATLEVDSSSGTLGSSTDSIYVRIDTGADLENLVHYPLVTHVYTPGQMAEAGYSIPEAYASEEKFVVVTWNTCVSRTGNTAYTLTWESAPESDTGDADGADTDPDAAAPDAADAGSSSAGSNSGTGLTWFAVSDLDSGEAAIDLTSRGMTPYYQISVAYPISQFTKGLQYTLSNTVTWTLTEVDSGTQHSASKTATSTYTRSDASKEEPKQRYNHHKSTYGSYPSAVNALLDGADVEAKYYQLMNAYVLPLVQKEGTDGMSVDDYGASTVTMQLIDGELELLEPISGATLALTPGTDFDFTSVTVMRPTVFQAIAYDASDIDAATTVRDEDGKPITLGDATPVGNSYGVGYVESSDVQNIPPITVEALVGGSWVSVATLDFSDGSRQTSVDFSHLEGTVESYRLRVELGNDPDGDGVFAAALDNVSAIPTITLHPTAAVQALAETALSGAGDLTLQLNNTDRVIITKGEETIYNKSASATDVLRGFNDEVAVLASKTATATVDNYAQTATVTYTASVSQISTLSNLETWQAGIDSGYLPSDSSGTWYDLLPEGAVPNMDSITLRTGDTIQEAYTIPDYQGTNRTLLVVKAQLTPTPRLVDNDRLDGIKTYADIPTLTFTATYSFDAMRYYGSQVHNVVAYASGNGSLGTVAGYTGEPDTPYSSNNAGTSSAATFASDAEKTALVDLDPADDNPRFVYAGAWCTVQGLQASVAELYKQVMVNNDGVWGTGTGADADKTVYAGGNYRYALSVGSAIGTSTSDIVFYDVLESYVPGASSEDAGAARWQGSFAGVDLSALEEAGVAPVVYYATSEVPISAEDGGSGRAGSALLDSGVWSTTAPADLSQVRAIAVDASTATDGSAFELASGQVLSVYIDMRAPSLGEAQTGSDGSGLWDAYAFNGAYLWATTRDSQDNSGAGMQSALTYKAYTKVGLQPFELSLSKVFDDAGDADGLRPGSVTVHLLRDGERIDPDISITLDGTTDAEPASWTVSTGSAVNTVSAWESGPWQLSITGLDPVRADGSHYVFSFEEDSSAGYTTSLRQNSQDSYRLSNVHEPQTVTVSGSKSWTGTDAIPATLTLQLLQDNKVIMTRAITPASDGSWSFSFTDLPRYHDQGTEYSYDVRELAGQDWISSTSTETDAQGDLTVVFTNSWHPYGDLLISKAVTGTADTSVDFSFTVQLLDGEQPLADSVQLSISNAAGDVLSTGTFASGNSINLRAGWTARLSGIPSGVSYQVIENASAGYTADTEVMTGTITSNTEQTASFTNSYSATGTVNLRAVKTLDGANLDSYRFRFELLDSAGTRVSVGYSDSTGAVIFGALDFTQADDGQTYTYTMREINLGVAGFSYSSQVYQAQISVADKGDGTLAFNVQYLDATGSPLADSSTPVFENSYQATGSLELVAYKTMKTGSIADYAGQFSFSLYNQDGEKLYLDSTGRVTTEKTDSPLTATNSATGMVVFPSITYTQEDLKTAEGSYAAQDLIYLAKEDIPNGATLQDDGSYSLDGIIYSSEVRAWSVHIEDARNGSISISSERVSIEEDNSVRTSSELPVFTNSTAPGSFSVEKHTVYPDGTTVDPNATFTFRVQLEYPSGAGIPDTLHYVIRTTGQDGASSTDSADRVDVDAGGASGSTSSTSNPSAGSAPSGEAGAVDDADLTATTADAVTAHGAATTEETATGTAETVPTASSTLTDTAAGTGLLERIVNGLTSLFAPRTAEASTVSSTEVEGSAYAVVSEDGTTMTFIRSTETFEGESGSTGTLHDLEGNSHTGTVYKNIEDNRNQKPQWGALPDVTTVIVQDVMRPTSYEYWFYGFTGLTSVVHSENLDAYAAGTYWYMFENCSSLTTVDLPSLRKKGALNIRSMFEGCTSLKYVDVSGFVTSRTTDIAFAFSGCTSLETLDVSDWDTSGVRYMQDTFANCSKLTELDVSRWNTSSVTNMSSLFYGLTNLESLDIADWDTSKVTNMHAVFARCSSLVDYDVSGWDTSSVTKMAYMFQGAAVTSLSLEKWDTSHVADMESMFSSSAIRYLDISGWDMSSVTQERILFYKTPLETLKLGPGAVLNSRVDLRSTSVDGTEVFQWYNVDTGRAESSESLMGNFDGSDASYVGTWVYRVIPRTISFDANGGAGSMSSLAYTGGAVVLPDSSFYRYNYLFAGWNTQADGSGTSYLAGESIGTAPDYLTDDLQLFAQWVSAEVDTPVEEGGFYITLKGGQRAVFDNLPAGTTVELTELPSAGWTLSSAENSSFTVSSEGSQAASFTNTRTPGSTSVVLAAHKTLDGASPRSSDFSFELLDSTGALVQRVQNNGASVSFAPLSFSASDLGGDDSAVLTYTIREVAGTDGGIIYDGAIYTATVTLSQDSSGELGAAVTYTAEDGTECALPVFANSHETGSLNVTKQVQTASPADADKTFGFSLQLLQGSLELEDSYPYVLTDAQGLQLSSGTLSSGDTFSLAAEQTLTLSDLPAGTSWRIAEEALPAGWSQLSSSGAEGSIDAAAVSHASFVNSYAASGSASIVAYKQLEGSTLAPGQFSFNLLDAGTGTVLQSQVGNGQGSNAAPIVFEPLYYSLEDVGTHHYQIVEVADAGNSAISYDSRIFDVYVDVADTGDGTLSTQVRYVNLQAGSGSSGTATDEASSNIPPTFENTTRTGSVSLTKTVSNPVPGLSSVFSFDVELSAEGSYPLVVTDGSTTVRSASVRSGDTIELLAGQTATISSLPVGSTYAFNEQETPGYIQSAAENLSGTITEGGTAASAVNTYTAGVSVQLKAQKELTGRTLEAGEFTFEVLENGEHVAYGTNSQDGSVVFNSISYRAADIGSHVYSICELAGTDSSISYDARSFLATVEVAATASGGLSADVSYTDASGAALSTVPTFENSYTPEQTATATIRAIKDGDQLVFENGRSYTFELQATSVDAPLPAGAVDGIATSSAASYDGQYVSFGAITYSAEGTYTYLLRETLPQGVSVENPVLESSRVLITYDTRELPVSVVVGRDSSGALDAQVIYDESAANPSCPWTFTNTGEELPYEASGTAQIGVTKSLEGREWNADESFTFVLSAEDGAPLRSADGETGAAALLGAAAGSSNQDSPAADNTDAGQHLVITLSSQTRSAYFPGLVFTYDDLANDGGSHSDKVFSYRVHEVFPDNAVFDAGQGLWVADNLSYAADTLVQVRVSDNGDGTLAVSVSDASGRELEDGLLSVVNSWTPPVTSEEPPAPDKNIPKTADGTDMHGLIGMGLMGCMVLGLGLCGMFAGRARKQNGRV